jgi:hypothetical protein
MAAAIGKWLERKLRFFEGVQVGGERRGQGGHQPSSGDL